MAETVSDGLQHHHGLLGHFRTDPVAGENSEIQEHAGIE
jgi:hypothetical protein